MSKSIRCDHCDCKIHEDTAFEGAGLSSALVVYIGEKGSRYDFCNGKCLKKYIERLKNGLLSLNYKIWR